MDSLLQSAKDVLKQMKENDEMISKILEEAMLIKQQSHTFGMLSSSNSKVNRAEMNLQSKKASFSYLNYLHRNYNITPELGNKSTLKSFSKSATDIDPAATHAEVNVLLPEICESSNEQGPFDDTDISLESGDVTTLNESGSSVGSKMEKLSPNSNSDISKTSTTDHPKPIAEVLKNISDNKKSESEKPNGDSSKKNKIAELKPELDKTSNVRSGKIGQTKKDLMNESNQKQKTISQNNLSQLESLDNFKSFSTGDYPAGDLNFIEKLCSENEHLKSKSTQLKQNNETLLKHNEALTRLVEEQSYALKIIMQKYREHTIQLIEKNKLLQLQQNQLEQAINNDEIYMEKNNIIDQQNRKIDDMISVMINAVDTDIQAHSKTDCMMEQLLSENHILRQILEIKGSTTVDTVWNEHKLQI